MRIPVLLFLFMATLMSSCGTRGPAALFKKQSPHEAYAQSLKSAGLQKTGLAKRWLAYAENTLSNPVSIQLPYRETGFFDASEPRAAAFRFAAKRGQMLFISLQKKSADSVKMFLDVWLDERSSGRTLKSVAYADTLNTPLQYAVDDEGQYVLRLQPELLQDVQYTLAITTGPSLGFPVIKGAKSNIGSYWGVDRDAGARRHEGIDIFAPKLTPAVAAAAGAVTRVNENYLGGLTVWMRPKNKDYTLYYAHLDKQIAVDGQQVMPGDTLGLIGNTGNARNTPSHLHFGIYGFGGAMNPLPFVEQVYTKAKPVTATLENLNENVRVKSARITTTAINNNLPVTLYRYDQARIVAAERNQYRLLLPDGKQVSLPANAVEKLSPFRITKYTVDKALLNQPSGTALSKTTIPASKNLSVLAAYGDYYYVDFEGEKGWVSRG